MKKPEMQVNVTRFSQEEIITLVKAECNDFNYIPEHEQWVMALYALGVAEVMIESLTGRTTGQIKGAITKYSQLTSTLPDNVKMGIHQRMMFNSIGAFVAVLTDKEKIAGMSPKSAGEVMRMLFDLQREYMKLEGEYAEHCQKVNAMTFKGFEKALGEGK
jgi:hypothetical protein